MAPTVAVRDLEPDYPGYWGPPTATIDWCEANYDVSFYVAEFCKLFVNNFLFPNFWSKIGGKNYNDFSKKYF